MRKICATLQLRRPSILKGGFRNVAKWINHGNDGILCLKAIYYSTLRREEIVNRLVLSFWKDALLVSWFDILCQQIMSYDQIWTVFPNLELAEEGEHYCFQIIFHGINNRTYFLSAETQEMWVWFYQINQISISFYFHNSHFYLRLQNGTVDESFNLCWLWIYEGYGSRTPASIEWNREIKRYGNLVEICGIHSSGSPRDRNNLLGSPETSIIAQMATYLE